MTTAHLHSPETSLSTAFERAAGELRNPSVTVRELLELIGEQGLLLFRTFLAVPFLLPVAIPGASTVFGLLMVLIGMVERDGIVIALGYLATVAAARYCGTIFWAAWQAGSGAAEWLRGAVGH